MMRLPASALFIQCLPAPAEFWDRDSFPTALVMQQRDAFIFTFGDLVRWVRALPCDVRAALLQTLLQAQHGQDPSGVIGPPASNVLRSDSSLDVAPAWAPGY